MSFYVRSYAMEAVNQDARQEIGISNETKADIIEAVFSYLLRKCILTEPTLRQPGFFQKLTVKRAVKRVVNQKKLSYNYDASAYRTILEYGRTMPITRIKEIMEFQTESNNSLGN